MRVDARFSGFPGFALGGYVAGVLAAGAARGGLEVRLLRPIPLGSDLDPGVDGTELRSDGQVVATSRSVTLDLTVPRTVTRADAEIASTACLGLDHHFFATCFCCGPGRPAGDGLRIFPGPVAHGVLAAPWRPGDAIGEATVPPEIVWAALDCPGIWAQVLVTAGTGDRAVTGSLAVRQLGPVPAGETLVVLGWPIDRDGRKIRVGAALTTERGEPLAIARQTLIVTDRGVPLDREVWQTAPTPPQV